MLNLDSHQNKIKYALITLVVILILLVGGLLYQANREMKVENPMPYQRELPTGKNKAEPLTQEQLNKAATQVPEKERTPLTPEQLEKASQPAK